MLPGMIDAAADTLHKAWARGASTLAAQSKPTIPRLDAIARLEAAVLDQLSTRAMMRPVDIVAAADQPRRVCAGRPRTDGDRRPDRTLALLASSAEGADCAYSRCNGQAGPRNRFPFGWKEPASAYRRAARAEIAPRLGGRQRGERPTTRPSRPSAGCAPLARIRGWRLRRSPSLPPHPPTTTDHFLALRADANIDLHFRPWRQNRHHSRGQGGPRRWADIVVRGLSQSRPPTPRGAVPRLGVVRGPARRLAARSCRPMRRCRRPALGTACCRG